MALKGSTSRMFLFTTFLALDLSLFAQLIVFPTAGNIGSRYSAHSEHATARRFSGTQVVQSVSVDDLFALDVVQQPNGNANYVSSNFGEVTQFSTVTEYGNVGLLAHNYLSGESFLELSVGQEVHLLYTSGKTEHFVITEILRYQALQPKSPFSAFRNVNNDAEILSAGQMFERAYAGEYHITFQTCIDLYGNSSWGRLFVVAKPMEGPSTLGSQSPDPGS